MSIRLPSEISLKPVAKNYKAVKCACCEVWTHIKYNKINTKT